MALPPAPVRGAFFRTGRRAAPLRLCSWYEVTGKVSEGHLRAGTRVEAVRKWKEATSYAEHYMATPRGVPRGTETGRIWGVWNEELLPVRWETVQVSLRDAYRSGRIYRKLAKERGQRLPTPHYGVREARERGQAAGVPGLLPGVAEKPFELRRRVRHLLPIPSRNAIRLLKAAFNAVVAEERVIGAQRAAEPGRDL